MKHLIKYKLFESKSSVVDTIKDLFTPIKDYCNVRIDFLDSYKDYYPAGKDSIQIDTDLNQLADEEYSCLSEWGVKYRPVKNGDYISTELSEISDRILNYKSVNIERVEIKWINAGEWSISPASKGKTGYGPGFLDKIFSPKVNKGGPIDGPVKGHYPIDMIPEFIERKGDRLRQFKMILTINDDVNESIENKREAIDIKREIEDIVMPLRDLNIRTIVRKESESDYAYMDPITVRLESTWADGSSYPIKWKDIKDEFYRILDAVENEYKIVTIYYKQYQEDGRVFNRQNKSTFSLKLFLKYIENSGDDLYSLAFTLHDINKEVEYGD